jgi:PAS domain S-box-containing protein
MVRNDSSPALLRRFSQLKERLAEVEDTLDAIRSGSVDALVVRTPRGEQLFTLKGADQSYRSLVENMNEGAVTLIDGIISFCNQHFARMAGSPLERIFGTPIATWLPSADFRVMLKALQAGSKHRSILEATLRTADLVDVPVLLSAGRFTSDGRIAVSLVVTDITERKSAERARSELSRRIVNAQEAERQRVARELHDGVMQLLSAAKYRLNLSSRQSAKTTEEPLEQVRQLLSKAIVEVRLISRNLRPSELDDLGLSAALRSLAHEFQSRYRIPVQCRCEVSKRLPTEVEMAFYRIAQEALTNVKKHACATHAKLAVVCSNNHAALDVHDNGKGLCSPPAARQVAGWGLKNMRERAELLGGSFSVSSAPGKGTAISVTIPLINHNGSPSRNGKQSSADRRHFPALA